MGVAANACFTLLGLEDAKAGQLDLLTCDEGSGDGVDGCVQNALCVLLADASTLSGCCDEFGFIQNGFLSFKSYESPINYHNFTKIARVFFIILEDLIKS